MTEQQSAEDSNLAKKEEIFQINEVISSLKRIDKDQLDENHKLKLQISSNFLAHILDNPFANYLSIGRHFAEKSLPIMVSTNKAGTNTAKIDDTFVALYRLAKEKFFRTNQLNNNDVEILIFYDKYAKILTDSDLQNKFYQDTTLTKEYFGIDSASTTRTKEEIKQTIEAKSAKLDDLENKTATAYNDIEEINKKIQTIKQNLNFVSLSKAFTQILADKTKEKNIALLACILLAILPLTIPTLLFLAKDSSLSATLLENFQDLFTLLSLSKIIPFLTIELISIYYFRIILQQFYNTKGQVLQLKLRVAICEFIEGYGAFLKESDFAEKHYFKQFEALIFSPIVPNPDQIPNTLDGIEQMAKIIKSCTGK